MDKIFASKLGRKKFLFTIGLLMLVCFLMRYFVLPFNGLSINVNENVGSFLEKFMTSVFTAVIVGYFLFWIQREETKKEITFTESGHEIEKYLSSARLTTESWLFNGGLGRYTKSDTIPKLSDLASKERKTISIQLVIINPFNISLIQKYIDFRASVEVPSKISRWTILEVRSEILATIITALFYKKKNQFLSISVRVKDFFTLSRMDISSTLAVITREDPAIPSIIAEKDSYMYTHYAEEFQQVFRQSKAIDYMFLDMNKPSKEAVKVCLENLFPGEEMSPDLIEQVFVKFDKPISPFV